MQTLHGAQPPAFRRAGHPPSFPLLLAAILVAAAALSCASLPASRPMLELLPAGEGAVEVGGSLPISARLRMPGGAPSIEWTSSAGSIKATGVDNEVDFLAPAEKGEVRIRATARAGGRSLEAETTVKVLPSGGLKKTAEILVEVDCNSLKGVWVDEGHPAENFVPPLGIKGTFGLDPDTGEARPGGSWPLYTMYDDGTHGDRVANDGLWSLRFVFPKTQVKVYFAFDDANAYRVGFESGLAWRLKLAWRGVDAANSGELSDANNLFFVPDRDQVVRWTAPMAEAAGLGSKPKAGN